MQEFKKEVSITGRKAMLAIPCADGNIDVRIMGAAMDAASVMARNGALLACGWLSHCSSVSRARNALAHKFLSMDEGFSDFLMLDSDTIPRGEDIVRLIARATDHPVVAGAVPVQSEKQIDIRYKFDPLNSMERDAEGLIPLKRIGTAFMNVRREVMKDVAEASERYWVDDTRTFHPLIFHDIVTEEGFVGEDYTFCDKVLKAGHTIMLDPDCTVIHRKGIDLVGQFGLHMQNMKIDNAQKDKEAALEEAKAK